MIEKKKGLFPFVTVRRHMWTKLPGKELSKKTVNEMNKLISYILLDISEELNKFPYRRLNEYQFKEAASKWFGVELYNATSLATMAKLEATILDLSVMLEELKRKRAEIYGEDNEEEII